MASFYRQLQNQVRKRSRFPGARKRSAAPASGPAKAQSRHARAFTSPVSYRVPGPIDLLRQPTSMTCWATVFTMLYGWKRQQSMSIPAALATVGQQYVDKFRNNQGLSSSEKGVFLAAAGLMPEPPQNYTLDGWVQLLRTYGPLWVTTDEDPSANFAIHARIMMGVSGDGSMNATRFQIVDPATGTEYEETFATFLRKYEEEARDSSGPLRIQVVHWPPNARSSTQSVGYARSNANGSPRRYAHAYQDAGAPVAAPAAPQLAWGARVSEAFRNRVREMAQNLGADADSLMAAMAFESAETFSPSVRNPRSGATGLIQFMPATARSMGTTTDALAAMTAEAQLDYVERYLSPYRGRLNSLEDIYMTILWPRAVGQPNDYTLFASGTRAYEQNRALDRNNDGRVTKEEASAFVRAKLVQGRRPENLG